MEENTIEAVLERLSASPRSASALTLYALACTLDHEEAGCLFRLAKLRDLDPGDRSLAYGLMDLMVHGETTGAVWAAARAKMDTLVGAG